LPTVRDTIRLVSKSTIQNKARQTTDRSWFEWEWERERERERESEWEWKRERMREREWVFFAVSF
jgi:hypothetical protein